MTSHFIHRLIPVTLLLAETFTAAAAAGKVVDSL